MPLREADEILAWFETTARWRLRVENFYEQYEFSLLAQKLPPNLQKLSSTAFVSKLAALLSDAFTPEKVLELVDISAHRLTPGQTIRVHNDYLGAEESHRILIQFNRGWPIENGGILMLFENSSADSVCDAILPTHASAFAFEISPRSYHAVSTIRNSERFTLVYTFRIDAGRT